MRRAVMLIAIGLGLLIFSAQTQGKTTVKSETINWQQVDQLRFMNPYLNKSEIPQCTGTGKKRICCYGGGTGYWCYHE